MEIIMSIVGWQPIEILYGQSTITSLSLVPSNKAVHPMTMIMMNVNKSKKPTDFYGHENIQKTSTDGYSE